jgi:hypothetical protein
MSTDITPRQLATLADEIRGELDAMEVAREAAIEQAGTALEHAIAAGGLLLEAKALVKHGEWIPWLEENFPFTRRWASACMRLARHQDELPNGNSLPISAALQWVARPETAPESPATNLLGEPDSRMQEGNGDWRARLRVEQGVDEPEPAKPERPELDGGTDETSAPGDREPAERSEPSGDQPTASEDKVTGEVLDDPLGQARKRYSSAASRAFRDNDAASARQALAVWRQEIKPALERVASDGIEIDRGRWRR